jgi:hypothetical protein
MDQSILRILCGLSGKDEWGAAYVNGEIASLSSELLILNQRSIKGGLNR